MKKHLAIALLTCCGLALPVTAVAAAGRAPDMRFDDEGPTPAEWARALKSLEASLGRLEFTLQYDKGESPGHDYGSYYAAMMGAAGAQNDASADENSAANWDQFIKDERPAERSCWFISPTRVIAADIPLHPRFIKGINVRVGDRLIAAKPVRYFRTQGMVIYELGEPAPASIKPLVFDASRTGPFFAVRNGFRDGAWITAASPLGGGTSVTSDGRAYSRVVGDILIVDKAGAPVGMWSNTQMPLDDTWKGAPEKWEGVSEEEMAGLLKALDGVSGSSVLRCVVNFRSPRQDSAGGGRYGRYGGMMPGGEDGGMTEWNGTAVVVDPSTAIVLANFKPRTTSRLEKVRLFTSDGQSVTGTFDGTLKDYGGFLVKLDSPVGTPAAFASGDVTDFRGELLLKTDIKVRGETRTAYVLRDRIDGFQLGWKRQLFPTVGGS
ncbi:MAG TPA: hypothetical protein VEB22_02075, partial [Phycisphaerales bacterium]|nr:hypothetical protein [Phycisphaerales bacterium]